MSLNASIVNAVEKAGAWSPAVFLLVFLAASLLMIWRLECMKHRGVEGTVLGTLVMPYCSGMGNLLFVFILARNGGPGREVVVNSLVNNVTNVTLLIGIPALIWGMAVLPGRGKRAAKVHRVNRLSLMLTMTAALFFIFAMWALARDGVLDLGDGLVLIALFLFWQCFQIFDVLKTNVHKNRTLSPMLLVDGALLAAGTWVLFISVDWLTTWVSEADLGFVRAENLGWLSGWLMVLPNAVLAFYYAWKKQAEIVYSSQIGDGHICIPLCVGLFACLSRMQVPEFFTMAMAMLSALLLVHMVFIGLFGRLPRWAAWALVAAYAAFHYLGLIA